MRSSRRMPPTTKRIKRFIAARTPRTSCVSTPVRNVTPRRVWRRHDRRSNGHRIETVRIQHMLYLQCRVPAVFLTSDRISFAVAVQRGDVG
jgi:hypothetical protein